MALSLHVDVRDVDIKLLPEFCVGKGRNCFSFLCCSDTFSGFYDISLEFFGYADFSLRAFAIFVLQMHHHHHHYDYYKIKENDVVTPCGNVSKPSVGSWKGQS